MRIVDPKARREVLFWSLHALGWAGYGLSQYVGAMVFDRPIGYTKVAIAATVFGILVTAPLRYTCRWLWGRSLFVMLPLAIVLAYTASLAWRLGVNWAYLQWYDEWYIAHWPGLLVAALNFSYLMAFWIGLYFGVRYYESMQVQREMALRATSLAQEAQLTMLRYQLNPHFLFNTLNAISTLILDNRNKIANSTVTKLAEFLRYTLDQDPSKKVTVAKEVEALNLYLDIEKLRFDSRLRIVFLVQPEASRMLLPSLLLQPLLENAIKYAASPREEGALIRILARVNGEFLELEVADDGPGIVDTERLTNGRGVGVRNTRERLQVLYGERSSVNVENAHPGLRVVLRFPAEPAVDATQAPASGLEHAAQTQPESSSEVPAITQ